MALTAEQAYALSKKYTKATADEFGAVKGAPCTIDSIVDIEGGHRITFSWENSSGQTLTDTLDLMDGEQGKSIADINQEDDKIILVYTDGTESDPITVPTIQGEKGDSGFSPEITVAESTATSYKLHIKTEDDEFDTPNLKGSGGGGGGNTFTVDDNGCLHITGGSGGGGGSAELQNDLTAHVTVGGTTNGETFTQGTPLESIFRDMLDPVMYPTLTNPSVSLTATGAKLLETGATLATTFTATFNRGSISPPYGGVSGYRSGEASGYSLNGGTTQTTNTWSVTVDESQKTYQATVSYEAGEQPKDSAGNNYGTPLASGSVNSNVIVFEFVDAMWSNVSNIATIAKMALVSKSTKQRDMVFPSQTVTNPEVFDIPASWTVTAVQVKNDLSGQFEDALSQFTVTDITHDDASGTSVNYKRYTFNMGMSTGSRTVRVKWS